MTKLMKIKSLKDYGIPSYILDIWEKHYSPYLLPIQEEAVRDYGVLDSRFRGNDRGGSGNDISKVNTRLLRRDAPRNDREGTRNDNNNLLVIAPTSSGKTFIGEMAAITQLIHQKKVIYLVPLRCLAEEKYRHFKNLYSSCGLEIVVSTRNHKGDDYRIIQGNYNIAVMVYEKFYYFLLRYPHFLLDVSLVVLDEMQLINYPKWGPLMENLIDHLRRKDRALRVIALSARIENPEALQKWFSAPALLYPQRPVELRKGMVREGIFKYITSYNKHTYQREIFFNQEAVQDNCFGDYLLETVRYFIDQNESTLIFFSTSAETRRWAKWLASRLESSATSSAIGELKEMEESLSRDELLELLPKRVAYHNQDLSWEERNLVETYLKKGEIKVICATNILALGISIPFPNVIISLDKIHHGEEDERYIYRTGLTSADIENMAGRAGILNMGKEGDDLQKGQDFGRVIFLAHSLFFETIYQELYFNYCQNSNHPPKRVTRQLVKKEKDLPTFLLRLLVNHQDKYHSHSLKQYLGEIRATSVGHQNKLEEENNFSGYWKLDFEKDNIEKEIDYALDLLVKNRLVTAEKGGILSPTTNGILVIAKGIKVETYLYFKHWIKNSKKGEISDLELLMVLALSRDGKELPIPCSWSGRNDDKRGAYNHPWEEEGSYWRRILGLILGQGEEEKEIYRDKFIITEQEEDSSRLEEHPSCKKTLLLYDWIKGNKEMKDLEQEYLLYEGDILRLAAGFCWLADSLAVIAESGCWKKKRKEDLKKITILSERLIEGIEEEGLNWARLYIPGLSRYYIRRLVKEGYNNEKCLREVREEELAKVLPMRLVKRIQKRIKEDEDSQEVKKQKVRVNDSNSETENRKLTTCHPKLETCNLKPTTVLEIDQHRPDRIIFQDKEIKLTPISFSLLYLLAQHRGQVVSYEKMLKELWEDEEDAIYTRINYHICKIRKDILKIMNKKEGNPKKVENIFKTIPGRGLMLNIKDEELKLI